jgi:Uma2 family endonuclease
VFFVAKDNLENIKATYLDGAADLIIEVISPESRGRDRGDKFYEYEAAGVKEYWLIDYERKQAEFYILGKNGIFKSVEADENQIYHSKVIKNLKINVKWLWKKKLPTLLEVLKDWKMV